MQNSIFRRALVCGITLLFIGVIITSSISGYIGQLSNQSTEETPTNFPFSNNGLLAYWSFDEGTGNVANDYSGHGYDGLIVGASWTNGYSGYALDFDGSNDYVNMDTHSQDLGFNNTDDYKISAWIKTTSTNQGIIYEISNPVYLLPVFYLKLNSDGTLNALVSSTETCSVEVFSDDSYNDGLWHYIECIFHGNEPEPTLELFVDEELVDSDTDYLCPMNAQQFNKARIGKTSYETTEYFDGIIDEVKVYKKPEGNKPPIAPNMSGPTSGTVGEEYSYIFVTTDPDGDNVFIWIDWGDNNNTSWIGPYNSNEEVNLNHIWTEKDTYHISAKAKDAFDMSEWSSFLVTMENLDPSPPVISGPTSGKVGTTYNYNFTATDPDGHDVKYFIDWGDGHTEWTDFALSGTPVTVSHTWSKRNTYIIKSKAKDLYNAESDLTTLSVTMPKNRAMNTPFLNFLQQHSNLFPIIRLLIQRFRQQ